MNEIARTVLISVVSGLLAFGGAVLYLGGDDSEPSEPSLTRADVFAMIDDTPPALTLPSLTRADVQAMIDSQPPELTAGNPAYESIMAGVDLALSEEAPPASRPAALPPESSPLHTRTPKPEHFPGRLSELASQPQS